MPNTKADNGFEFVPPAIAVVSSAQIYQGGTVFRDPAASSLLKSAGAGTHPYFQAVGVSSFKQLGDGTATNQCDAGLHERENAGSSIPSTLPFGWPLYAPDNQSASLTNGGGLYPKLGVFGGWSQNGKPLVWIGCDPYCLGDILWPVVFGFADVAAGGAALTVDLLFGPVTPGPARIMAYSCDALTVFSGGSIATATFKLGITTGGAEIHAALDIFTGATAAPKHGTAGTYGYAGAPIPAGTQIQGRVTTTTANVSACVAGAFAGAVILRPGS